MEDGALGMPRFTTRELQVLALVVAGYSAKEIARTLAIGSRTVEAHIEKMKAKTGSRNCVHMAAKVVRGGVVWPLPD